MTNLEDKSAHLPFLIDSHLHLDMEAFEEDQEQVIKRAFESNIESMITIGTGSESCLRGIKLAQKYEGLYATVGVHPHSASLADFDEIARIRELLKAPEVVGLGEVGLDYFYMNSPKETQLDVFRKMTRMSLETEMPIIIHTRDAEADTLKILDEERAGQQISGVIHCFSGSQELAERCIEMGLYISLSGMITFIKSLQKVVKHLPLSRLLVETDAPFLAPAPHRGERNEPAYVRFTAEKLARLQKVSIEELALQTVANTKKLFRL